MIKLKKVFNILFFVLIFTVFINVSKASAVTVNESSLHSNCNPYSFTFQTDKSNYDSVSERVNIVANIHQATTDPCHLSYIRVGTTNATALPSEVEADYGLIDPFTIGSLNSPVLYWASNELNGSWKDARSAWPSSFGDTFCTARSGGGYNCKITFYAYYTEVCENGCYPESAEISHVFHQDVSYTIGVNPLNVNITASPTTIDQGQSSTISWTSSGADSCTVSVYTYSPYSYIGTFGSGTSGSLSTGPLANSRQYNLTCTQGGTSGGNNDQGMNFHKNKFLGYFKKLFFNDALAEGGTGGESGPTVATDSVVVMVNQPTSVTLTLESGYGNDGEGKDLVDANITDSSYTLGISHLVPDINGIGTNGSCYLYKENIVDPDNENSYPNDYTIPILIKNIPANSGTSYKLKCNNDTIIANLKYPNGSLATVKGQAGTVTPGQNANGGCVNPNQGGAQACCVIQENQSSCNVSVNWSTVNSAKTVQNGNVSYFENGSLSHITDADSGNSLGIGIGTVDSPLSYNLHNEVDGESANTTSDNLLGTIKLKSECAPGLSNIDGVCKTDASNLPDLIAQNTQAPGNVEGGETFTVTTTIKNQGNKDATQDPIYVLFQATDTDPGQTQGGDTEAYNKKQNILEKGIAFVFGKERAEATTVIEKYTTIKDGLRVNQEKNTSTTFSFSTVGNRWIRACADKMSAGDSGLVEESSETNNCSSWKKVTVGLPDLLTMNTQAAATVPVNTALSVSTTVKNQGNGDANSTFYVLFQTATTDPNPNPNGGQEGQPGGQSSWLRKFVASIFGIDKVNAAGSTPPALPNVPGTVQVYGLSAGGSIGKSLSLTFNTVGDKWIRTCADKKSPSDVGLIHESNEGNNCSGWIKVTVVEPAPQNSDLQASTPTPTVAVANKPITFSSTILNAGNESTLVSFYNLFQTKPNLLSSDITDYRTNFMMPAVLAGQSKVAQRAITFTTPGQVYMRACADKSSQADATGLVHNESNENNNCSSWVLITISPTGAPDLTIQRGVIPTSAQVGVSTTFRTTVNNIGALTTGASFPNIFQVSSNASGLGAETFSAGDLSELQAGESVALSTNYTFANEGTYYARFCTDLNTRIQGVITEENENNNCSPWTETTITKDKEQCPNGAVNWPECTLDGDGDCINGALNPPQCDEFNNTSGAQCNNSVLHGCLAGVDENHSEGQDYYYWDCRLKDSVAHCFYPKNGGVGTGNGDEGNVTLTAVPSWIFKGRISTLTWSSWSGASCSIMPGEFTGLLDNGSLQMRPSETTTYTANCTDSTNTGQASATVKVINPLIFEQ